MLSVGDSAYTDMWKPLNSSASPSIDYRVPRKHLRKMSTALVILCCVLIFFSVTLFLSVAHPLTCSCIAFERMWKSEICYFSITCGPYAIGTCAERLPLVLGRMWDPVSFAL